jgi:hypothetical protein
MTKQFEADTLQSKTVDSDRRLDHERIAYPNAKDRSDE